MTVPERAQKRTSSKRGGGGGGGGGGGDAGPPEPRDSQGRLSILVELLASPGMSAAFAPTSIREFGGGGFQLDEEFQPVPLGSGTSGFAMGNSSPSYVVRALVEEDGVVNEIQSRPDVLQVWRDAVIQPFGPADCPISPCDCDPATPKGTIADVATYLGVSQLWSEGFRGAGIVVGVVDGGITAQGRPIKPGEGPRRIARVIGGWPVADWGTEADRGGWQQHGNMCATDVLGMAPEARLYDLRISGGDAPATVSRALQAYQWAIDQRTANGTPHILSNSWGMWQQSWEPTYATNPGHPFTRKVAEAIDAGILVLFAAGNCGAACGGAKCGGDKGPGRSIWGANGHPRVMTVGAVNKDEHFVGYSSQGPAALDPNKPDFCSVTHFTGYFQSDSGTSAATPILAGAVALLKQAVPAATQDGVKTALKATAKDIGPAGFDQHSGSGIVQIKAAFDRLRRPNVIISRTVPCPPKSLVTPCVVKSVATPCWPTSSLQTCNIKSLTTPCVRSVAVPCPVPIPSAFAAMCTPIPVEPVPASVADPAMAWRHPVGVEGGAQGYQDWAEEEGEYWYGEWPQE